MIIRAQRHPEDKEVVEIFTEYQGKKLWMATILLDLFDREIQDNIFPLNDGEYCELELRLV